MNSASELFASYWPLAALAGVLLILLLVPFRGFMRRRAKAKPAEAPAAPPPPPMTAVQRLAASIEQAAREKAEVAKVPVTVVAVPPQPRKSAWTARPDPIPAALFEPEAPVLPSAALEDAAEPPPLAGHRAFGRPSGLSAPRAGGRDDLKVIYGIGPRIERGLHALGIYHYDQIAGWDRRTVVWVENHFSLRGKVTRERWVQQARALAPGRSLRSGRA
jgi:predicted flap endonuclease-1-like 5' DNA nuclease